MEIAFKTCTFLDAMPVQKARGKLLGHVLCSGFLGDSDIMALKQQKLDNKSLNLLAFPPTIS